MADYIDNSGDLSKADAATRRLMSRLDQANRNAEQFLQQEKKDASLRKKLTSQLDRDIKEGRLHSEAVRGSGSSEEVNRQKTKTEGANRRIEQQERRTAAAEQARTNRLKENVRLQDAYGRGQQRIADQARRSTFYGGPGGLSRSDPRNLPVPYQRGGPVVPYMRPLSPQTGYGAGAPPYGYQPPGQLPPGRRPLQLPPAGGTGYGIPTAYGVGAQDIAANRPVSAGLSQITAQSAAIEKKYEDRAKAANVMQKAEERSATTLRQSTGIVSGATNAYASSNNVLRRHGALTTEFIAAAGRGAVTIRELGYQVGATAAKFGGWLLGGAGIFAGIGAISAMGRGAIDSASGVNKLERVLSNVDADQATEGLRKLSDQFNLPIETVSEAVYGMGKRFKDLDTALASSESALYAVKVGELDAADATKRFLAVATAFGLEGDELTRVFDQVNQAQNQWGATIPDMTAGLAKASNSFAGAGGEIDSLIAFMTLAQKVTSQTGDVIGTAFLRVPTRLNQPEARAQIQSFGLDPDQDIDDLLVNAAKKAQDLNRSKQVELANALFGPFFGPKIGVPLFRNFAGEGGYNEVLNDPKRGVREDIAKGSGAKELNKLLGSVKERLSAILTSLEQIGSAAETSGMLVPFKVLLFTLQQVLSLTETLLGLFGKIPEPFRSGLTTALQLYGALRLMRRFQFGTSFFPEGSSGQRFFDPQDGGRGVAREGLVQGREFLNEQIHQESRARAIAASEASIAATQAEAQALNMRRLGQAQMLLSQEAADTAENVAKANDRRESAAKRETEGRNRVLALQRQLHQFTAQEELLRRGVPKETLTQIYGTQFPDQLPGQERDPIRQQGTEQILRDSIYREGYFGPPIGLPDDIEKANVGLSGWADKMEEAHKPLRQSGAVGRAVSKASVGGVRLAGYAANAMGAAGRGLGTVSRSIYRSLGPLDLLLGGLIGIAALAEAVQDKATGDFQRKLIGSLDKINTGRFRGPEDYKRTLDTLDEAIARGTDGKLSFAQSLQQSVADSPLGPDGVLGQFYDLIGFEAPKDQEAEAARRAEALKGKVEEARQTYIDLFKLYGGDVGALREDLGKDSAGFEQYRGLLRREKEKRDARQQTSLEIQEAEFDLLAAKGPLYDDAFQSAVGLAKAKAGLRKLKEQGAKGEELKQAGVEIAEAERDYQAQINDRALALLEARTAVRTSRIKGDRPVAEAASELQGARDSFKLLKSQGRFADPAEKLKAEDAINQAEEAYRDAIKERALALADIANREAIAKGPLYAPLFEPRRAVAAAKRVVRTLRRTGGTGREIREALLGISEAERELRLAVNDRALELLQARFDLASVNTDSEDTVGQAQDAVNEAQAVVNLMREQGRDDTELIPALAALGHARNDLADAMEERADAIAAARFELAKARAYGNDLKIAKIEYRAAQDALARADTLEERILAQARVIEARKSLDDAAAQKAIEDVEFSADIGKLSLDAQISEYRKILKSMDLTREMRRDLRRRIYQLKQEVEGESDNYALNVGDIKLPTIYEIRRAIQGGISQAPVVNVNQENTYTAHGSNADEIVSKIRNDQADAARRNRNLMRSAGLDG